MLVLRVFQLLGELLLDRHNFQTMTRYISSPENLKLMMIMLREKSRNIQFEAFHVFKVSHATHAAQGLLKTSSHFFFPSAVCLVLCLQSAWFCGLT